MQKKFSSGFMAWAWVDYDFFVEEQRTIKSLTIILRTKGCQWRKCTMCSYWRDSANEDISQEKIFEELVNALKKCPEENYMLKIFTSGSFFDEREISDKTRDKIMKMVKERGEIKKMIVETRPEFVNDVKISDCVAYVPNFEVAIGLETANDFIRAKYINKGFSFEDYIKAAKTVRKNGASLKTYLLLKPPFVSEKKAIEDVIKSAEDVSTYTSTSTSIISLNPCNIQKGTFLEELWQKRYYRPPWLWSAVETLKEIKKRNEDIVVISDPVGAGYKRGPHNCGKCDIPVKKLLKKFSITQDMRILEGSGSYCECKETWNKLIELNDFLFDPSY